MAWGGLRIAKRRFSVSAIIFTENSVCTLPSVALGLTTLKLSSVNRLIISLLQSKADLYR